MSQNQQSSLSHLESLFQAFQESPFKVAPEKEAELVKIRDKHGLSIELDERDKDWLFEVRPLFGLNRITVSLRSLERLWSVCYAYTAISSELLKYEGDFNFFEPSDAYSTAFKLLDWVAQYHLEEVEQPWPDDLPNPRSKSHLEYVGLADHYFLMTSGRILLHEIAHVELSHTTEVAESSACPIQEELEADDWADSWMLSDWSTYKDDKRVFIGRNMGIGFCHAITLYFGSKNASPSTTHPNPINRLVNFTNQHLPPGRPIDKLPEHSSCGLLLVVISHLLMEKGVKPDFGNLERTYSEVFSDMKQYFN